MLDKLKVFLGGTVSEFEDTKFDGTILEFAGVNVVVLLLMIFTLGIGTPWAMVFAWKWAINHTVLKGKRLKFVGTGGKLFLELLKWIGLYFASIVVLIILSALISDSIAILIVVPYIAFIFGVPVRIMQWCVAHTTFEEDK